MRLALTAAAVAIIAGGWLWLQSAEGEESLQQLWLQAEAEPNPARAVKLWKKLAASSGHIADGVTTRDAERELFTRLLPMSPANAEKVMANWEPQEKIYALLLLAKQTQRWHYVDEAAQLAESLTEVLPRSYALHAVVMTALPYRWDGPALARKLIPEIRSPRHRANAQHRLALLEKEPTAKWKQKLHHALRIEDAKQRGKALHALHAEAKREGLFTIALEAVSGIENDTEQKEVFNPWFRELIERKDISRAVQIADRLSGKHAAKAWSKLARVYTKQGQFTRAKSAIARCRESGEEGEHCQEAEKKLKEWQGRKRFSTLSPAAQKKAEEGDLIGATEHLRNIEDTRKRVQQFRRLAEYLANRNDKDGVLNASLRAARSDPGLNITPRIATLATPTRNDRELEISTLSVPVHPPKFPVVPDAEKLSLTVAELRANLPLPTPYNLTRQCYENSFFINRKFMTAIGHAAINAREKILAPEVIFLQSGTATLPQIYDALQAEGVTDYLVREGAAYTLRRGLLVGNEATLVIDGSEVNTLRLVQQAGAILVNAGNLHVVDTQLLSWDEDANAPTKSDYATRYDFRPFIASWSGSHSYIGGNEITGLGYANHKSYGVSFSSGPKKMQVNALYEPQRPDGIITDNSFTGMYYGFYSYEADDVALIGNEYRDSIIYGIDPHDRSQRLTIGYNTAYGSLKKHGIIISREVDDSSYLGNLSFSNHGSGFMIDRASAGTYVYANTAFGNNQDGLTIFESDCNLVAANDFSGNRSMGIRLRNSVQNGVFANRLQENRQGGFYGYTSDLHTDVAHATRNFSLDPFVQHADAVVAGNRLLRNGVGVLADDMTALLLQANRFFGQSPKLVQGAWFREHPTLTAKMEQGVLLRAALREHDPVNARPCRFAAESEGV